MEKKSSPATNQPTASNMPHTLDVAETLGALESSLRGLSESEAAKRVAEFGPNSLPEQKTRSVAAMVVGQFADFLILLLLGAAVISGVLGELIDTIAITVIVVLNAVIGVIQEFRAERAMEALRKMSAETATVRRDGRVREIRADELTVGDVVLLDAGRIVPADIRVVESARLRIAEAALTGESLPVDKHIDPLDDADAPLGDRVNMAYRGTHVVYGRGVGVVAAIGSETELGRIAGMLEATGGSKTPLQKRLAQFGKMLSLAALGLCTLVFVIGLLRGEKPLVMFLTAVSLAVAAVPEALPAVATVTLALGARRFVKTAILVRRLPAVETLGSVTYICTDKTGTLTLNRMTVEQVATSAGSEPSLTHANTMQPGGAQMWLATAMAISNDVSGDADDALDLVGDPTEVALLEAAAGAGLDIARLASDLPRVAEVPFDSERKLMTTIHAVAGGGFIALTKGAAEAVLDRSHLSMSPDGALAELVAEKAMSTVHEWAADGMRVLGFAMRRLETLPEEDELDGVEAELTFLGLAALVDPPRPEAAEAVRTCRAAGITPVMVTGDHPSTAMAIAKRLGIAEDEHQLMTGTELDSLELADFEQRVEDVRVYARVAPAQKLKIVQALQDKGEFVGMTGDGVNDAPALARADIGIAMGITGTDVAKEAADMVLLDDNFASIVNSVGEGRRIFDNIRKFIKYTMTSNSGEIWTIMLAPLVGLPIPLLPIHILWINLATDGLPGLALAPEPSERNIMKRPPRPPKESIFADGLAAHLIWVGLLMGAVSLVTQAVAIRLGGDVHWQTMVFTVLCFSQLGHVLAIRSDRQSFFTQGWMSNKPLAGAVALTVALQLATIYVPFLQPVFKTQALSLGELTVAMLASTVVFWAVEIEKWTKRRRDAA
jgi:Ca2+-transporting ATPase